MTLEQKFAEIKNILSLSDQKFNLNQIINESYQQQEVRIEILEKILKFVYHFSMFKQNKMFMNSVYECITETLEMHVESIDDFDQLFVKNALMKFIKEYIAYSKISHNSRKQVLSFLADSLERLDTQPLVINLGILIKPMYQDQEYLENLNKIKEVEVEYTLNGEQEVEIKQKISNWIEEQELSLDIQDELKSALQQEYNSLVEEVNLSKDSEIYEKLLEECMEMLNMKLTYLSLMGSVENELEPASIK
ncbi:MAG: hypothetical protein R6U96_18085 [Promethearchaeia archaeon]